jgi:hypothetical protein
MINSPLMYPDKKYKANQTSGKRGNVKKSKFPGTNSAKKQML